MKTYQCLHIERTTKASLVQQVFNGSVLTCPAVSDDDPDDDPDDGGALAAAAPPEAAMRGL